MLLYAIIAKWTNTANECVLQIQIQTKNTAKTFKKKDEKFFALTCWISVPKKPEVIWKSPTELEPHPKSPSQIQLWFGGYTRRPP